MVNLLVFMNTATLGEALEFGARAGLDRAAMVDASFEDFAARFVTPRGAGGRGRAG